MNRNREQESTSSPRANRPAPSHAPWPVFAKSEIDAVVNVLKSGRVNAWTGEQVRLFEQEFASSVGAEHAVAVANGTVGLELALWALGIGAGDEVITTSRSFVATASSIVMRGATPVFADVDARSQNLTARTIEAVLSPRTRAIIVVHLGGWPCEMTPILELARAYRLKVIEDCAQAQGASYRGRAVGTLGDAGVFSFCQDKIMTTGGEGGMLTTNDRGVWEKAWSLKDHGKNLGTLQRSSSSAVFRWVHDEIGTNWRMTEMQAAIGRVALKRIPLWLEMRRCNADTLRRSFAALHALQVFTPPDHSRHAYYKFYAFVRPERLRPGWGRDRILAAVRDAGVPCFSGSCSEIYLEKAFDRDGLGPLQRHPVAKELGENSLMFLVHPTLSHTELWQTAAAVIRVMERASLPREMNMTRSAREDSSITVPFPISAPPSGENVHRVSD